MYNLSWTSLGIEQLLKQAKLRFNSEELNVNLS